MEATSNGRALPPRPSLLVGKAGDVGACELSWAQLEPLTADLIRRADAGCASTDELDSTVRRFRFLRESLVAAYVQGDLAIQVYEASADVCLAAQCWSEYLKSVNGLTSDLYPAQHLQQQQQAAKEGCAAGLTLVDGQEQQGQRVAQVEGASDTEDEAGSGRSVACVRESEAAACSSSSSTGGRQGGRRSAEMYSAHCLFLACVPSGRVADAVAVLRNPQVRPYMSSSHMQFAVKVLSAMAVGDWYSFLRLRDAAPCGSLRAILAVRAGQVLTVALRCLSASYRTLPVTVAVAMLRIRDVPEGQSNDPCGKGHAQAAAGCGSCGSCGSSSGATTGEDDVSMRQHHRAPAAAPEAAARPEGMTHGSASGATLRGALASAAASGVKGAVVALEGFSALETGGAAEPIELVFRS